MSKQENLKRKNTPLVLIFIIWCLALYVTFLTSPSDFWSKLLSIFQDFNAKDGIIIFLSPILVLILNGVISSENKARIVYWRLHNALPGHRVFSKLANKDPRIDMDVLLKKISVVPESPKDQNTKWYAIYKIYSEVVTIKDAHRFFLLARDLSSISFIFSLLGPWGILIFQGMGKWALIFFVVMIIHYLVLAIVAQNHGNRFVCNVLVEYISDNNS